jgi:predicted phosphodiesterase
MPPPDKFCRKCGQTKPLTREHWKRDPLAVSGFASPCRACENASRRERRKSRRAAIRASLAPSPAPATRTTTAPRTDGPWAPGGVQKIAMIFDAHHPEHDPAFWRALLAWLRDEQPDEIVVGGDFGDLSSVNPHAKTADGRRLTDEVACIGQALDELADAAPRARRTFLQGNHEVWPERLVQHAAPELAGMVSLEQALRLDERGWTWVDEHSQPIQRGKLRILHGHQFGGKFGLTHHAAKAAQIYGGSDGIAICYGHTHRPQSFSLPVYGGAVRAYGIGCGRNLGPKKVRWLRGREAGWLHEFAVAYLLPDGSATVYPVPVDDGRFVWAGKLYNGRAP